MPQLNNLAQNNTVSSQDNPILQGNYGPVDTEQKLTEFEVIGEIPKDLNGTLLRTGPNPVDPQPNHHWFVGDGMLHAIQIANGTASSYCNRWVRTEAIQEKLGLAAAPVSDTKLMIQGSGNVNVVHHGERVLALPEIGLPYEMDLALNTKRMYDYDGKLASNMTAHPKIDPETGEMLFFGYDLLPPFLKFHIANAQGELIRSIDIELPQAVMMHDFSVTQSRVIFMDLPVVGDFSVMEKGFSMPFSWNESHQARLGILSRDATADRVQWINIDPCYVFHPLNAYDDGDKIVMDVVKYQKMFTAEDDRSYDQGSNLVRWTIDPTNDTVEETIISTLDQEFPRVNPLVECHPHRYGYVLRSGGEHGFQGLIKYDLVKETNQYHPVGDNKAGGEPIFVPRGIDQVNPEQGDSTQDNNDQGSALKAAPLKGRQEDAGYILTVVYDGATHESELHILDAQDFEAQALAIVKLGARVPFGFHGNFVPA